MRRLLRPRSSQHLVRALGVFDEALPRHRGERPVVESPLQRAPQARGALPPAGEFGGAVDEAPGLRRAVRRVRDRERLHRRRANARRAGMLRLFRVLRRGGDELAHERRRVDARGRERVGLQEAPHDGAERVLPDARGRRRGSGVAERREEGVHGLLGGGAERRGEGGHVRLADDGFPVAESPHERGHHRRDRGAQVRAHLREEGVPDLKRREGDFEVGVREERVQEARELAEAGEHPRGAAREVQDELVETLDGVRADLPVAEVAKARDRGVRHEPELIARVRHRRGHRDDDARTTREARRGAETTEARRTRKRARASSRKRSVESVAPAPPRSARIESPGPARDPAPSRAEAERTRRALSRRSTCRDTPSRARSTTESPERRTRANVACRVERRRMSGKSGIVYQSRFARFIRRSFQS